jgi:hypothetical protein
MWDMEPTVDGDAEEEQWSHGPGGWVDCPWSVGGTRAGSRLGRFDDVHQPIP